jgi:RNA polymerase sigma-70 factor (ECF subfamily)
MSAERVLPSDDGGGVVERSPDTDPTDEALVVAAADGDARAFQELIGRHESRVLRVLRLMGVAAQDREDVAQDVFIRIFRHLSGFHRGRPFQAWVYRIAVNSAHDYRTRQGRSALESGWEETAEPVSTASGPESEAELRDLRLQLTGAMAELTDRERAVFILREVEGLTTIEVARALGIARVTVRRHLNLARKRLRVALGGNDEP